MNARHLAIAGLTSLTLTFGVSAAFAGPCTTDIADLGRKLSQSPALGPPTTGTLTGSNPSNKPDPNASHAGAPTTTGTSASDKVGGTAGTKEANAVTGNQVATSPQDVRRQQEGLPTAAAAAATSGKNSVETNPQLGSNKEPNRSMSEAKMALEKARTLDHANDESCKGAVEQARKLMNG